MADPWHTFETVVRRAHTLSERDPVLESSLHPFDRRNIHSGFPAKVRRLFDDGHYAEATFEAYKYVDKTVKRHARANTFGFKLMNTAFDEVSPLIQLTPLGDLSEINVQKGFKLLFSGSVLAIRNPRGHDVDIADDVDTCLDHIGLASMLLRRLEESGYA